MSPKKISGPAPDVADVVAELRGMADPKVRDGMARYAIPTDHALGIAVGDLRAMGKRIGRHPDLARALWSTGIYEARMVATFVHDPAKVTPDEMDQWIADTDNWGLCDTLCFHLYDKTPHAFGRVHAWADRPEEFVKRGAFALLASLAGHDKKTGDAPFLDALPLVEAAAVDPRNFVKKGVSWALRGVGERNAVLHAAARAMAERLAASSSPPARWVGKDALRDFAKPAVQARLAKRARPDDNP